MVAHPVCAAEVDEVDTIAGFYAKLSTASGTLTAMSKSLAGSPRPR